MCMTCTGSTTVIKQSVAPFRIISFDPLNRKRVLDSCVILQWDTCVASSVSDLSRKRMRCFRKPFSTESTLWSTVMNGNEMHKYCNDISRWNCILTSIGCMCNKSYLHLYITKLHEVPFIYIDGRYYNVIRSKIRKKIF